MKTRIIDIGDNYEELSIKRNDTLKFNSIGFVNFAKQNINKYGILNINNDLFVGTWYCNDLINDYKKTLK